MDKLAGIYQRLENTFSPTTKGAPGSGPTLHARKVTAGNLIHPQMGCQAMRSGLQGNWKKRMMMMKMKSPVPPLMRSAQTPLMLSRVPTQAS